MNRRIRRNIATAALGLVTAVAPALVATAPAAHAAGTPILNVGDASVYEGDTGGVRTITFAVTLAEPSATNITFDYTLVPGTATAGTDYIAPRSATKTMTIKAGRVLKLVNVPVRPDTDIEGDETFQVMLSNPTGGASIADDMGMGTTIDDEGGSGLRLGVGDTIIHEGDVKYRVAKFWLTLSDRAPAPVTVRATTMAMSATAGSDFRAVTRTITFKAGQFKKPVTVRIEPDTDGEGDEQFHLMVQNPSGVTIADDTGIGTIVENDAGTGPVVTTEMFQVGPFNLNPKGQAGDQDERTAAVPRPSGHVGIKGMRFDLVDGSGTSVGHDIAHLHHIVMLDQSRPDSLCPSLPNRFGGTGMERTEMVLSGDYVYETQPSDQWSGLWHIMNQSSSAQTLYLRYEIDYITDFTNAKPVTSYFYDVDGCWGDSEFTVPGGGGPGSIFEKTKTYTAPASGIRVFTGGHVHPGGIDISLAQNATIVCTATGMYMMGMLHSISTCPDPTPVTAGDTIAIRGRYDNENQILGMMGIMLSYVWQP